MLIVYAFAVGLSILFFRFFVSARGRYTFFFLFYYHRPEAKLLLVIFFAIARGRKQLTVKKMYLRPWATDISLYFFNFARGRKGFPLIFVSSPVGEERFLKPY